MIFFRRLAQAELINNLANLSDRTLAGSDGFFPFRQLSGSPVSPF